MYCIIILRFVALVHATTVTLFPEVFIESAVLPVAVYEGLKNKLKSTPISPVTAWRWQRSVLAFNEEPDFDGAQVMMTPLQMDRMRKGWDMDVLGNWKLLRQTVRGGMAQGKRLGGIYKETGSLGFTASKNQIRGLMNDCKRKTYDRAAICVSPIIRRSNRMRSTKARSDPVTVAVSKSIVNAPISVDVATSGNDIFDAFLFDMDLSELNGILSSDETQ